ncbi:hypothetical protein [Celeribacter indicus]|uniref:Lipoprotein n=1 Tax=Celeribacter indicus TaxID=1208324 RepID=A0A0B5E3T4_9RHOB|nr:hypothetical protein [Celeribacter indicus]AJE48035.1 hypothetical protein P73_3320 [Celeribacter indicus]SDW30114.1 hypothetical protein SAMN05443573_102313 [Celeribacter indicus]
MTRPRLLFATLLALSLAACGPRPDLSGRVAPVDPNLPWPELLSTETLAATLDSTTGTPDAPAQSDSLSARARALSERAAALAAQPSLDTSGRPRLDRAARGTEDGG